VGGSDVTSGTFRLAVRRIYTVPRRGERSAALRAGMGLATSVERSEPGACCASQPQTLEEPA